MKPKDKANDADDSALSENDEECYELAIDGTDVKVRKTISQHTLRRIMNAVFRQEFKDAEAQGTIPASLCVGRESKA